MKVTAVIDNLDEATAFSIRMHPGERYEIVYDYVSNLPDYAGLELHFRLAELTATRPAEPVVQDYSRPGWRTGGPVTVAGLDGAGPGMPVRPGAILNVTRLADLLSELIYLTRISPRVLGIPGGAGPLDERIETHLTTRSDMGAHEKPGGDSKPGSGQGIPASGGGKHEKGGKGK